MPQVALQEEIILQQLYCFSNCDYDDADIYYILILMTKMIIFMPFVVILTVS